jgi:hypothetical protein
MARRGGSAEGEMIRLQVITLGLPPPAVISTTAAGYKVVLGVSILLDMQFKLRSCSHHPELAPARYWLPTIGGVP